MSQDLVEQARRVASNAHAPYSEYFVGCALLDERSQVHVGCNVENISYGGTICAERSAVCAMVASGGKRVAKIAVYTRNLGTPCGMCLQVLSEFCEAATEVILADESGTIKSMQFQDLLPNPFHKLV